MASTLGGRLRELRQAAGATQKEISDAIGLAISSVSSYEQDKQLPPETRLDDYATALVLKKSRGGTRLAEDDQLTGDEQAERDSLLQEFRALTGVAEAGPAADLWTFPPNETIMLVVGRLEDMSHPYSSSRDPNYTDLLTFADVDALIELHGHVRARNPTSDVRFIRADRLTEADQFSAHLIMIGGPGLNEQLLQVFDLTDLPITQGDHPDVKNGEVFYVDGIEQPELPTFAGRGTPRLVSDVGLLARVANPFNSARTLTWCSGIYSRGVYGAVRMLTDARLREQNGTYLTERFGAATAFVILVRVLVVLGQALTPDLQNDEVRLFEWPGKADPARDEREAGG